ncbi:MAG: endolytic transglycosylase MltG [Lachnospiraceae bacterium]|nr:aminodeoxychorismate lyase [uncultured Acetatifactor sp.]MCI8286641.1 endolytic transglycosylase MltG [Lachnospiraceae bacterium]
MKALSIIGAVAGAIFRVVAAVAVVYVIYRGVGICYDYGYRIFTEPAVAIGEGRTVTVSVTEEMKPLEIGELFESRGLIRDAKLFVLQYYLSEYTKDVGPGTFELSTAMTVEEMMQAMVVEKEEDTKEDAEEEEE